MGTAEYKLSKTEQKFKIYYGKLIWEILYARAHLTLWEQLQKYRSDYIHELNQAPNFFQLTIKAHLDDCLLTLARILDQHPDALSIWKFLNFIEQNSALFSVDAFAIRIASSPFHEDLINSHLIITPSKINEDRTKLDASTQAVNSIEAWRDKTLAHIDRKFVTQKRVIDKDFPLRIEQLRGVIESLLSILNSYNYSFEAASFSSRFPGEDDVQTVMDALRFSLQENDRKMKLEIESMRTAKKNP